MRWPWGANKGAEPPARNVHINDGQHATLLHHYASNKTSTTKYNVLTFLPKSLFEQYRRVANIYFTLVAALSLTPYSPVRPWTTIVPLVLVLGVSIIKEGVEDYRRFCQDKEINNRQVKVYDCEAKAWVHRRWCDLMVGDMIQVHRDEYFPADLLFISGEHEEGICYIETMNLDGETNLKIKKALDESKDFRPDTVSGFQGLVRCEPPNSRLYTFVGNLDLQPPVVPEPITISLNPNCVLLRGSSLRNTERIVGAVIYAGHDTKVFMNATKPPSKRSQVERTVDKIIYFMFSVLFSFCIIGAIYFSWWTQNVSDDMWYLEPNNAPPEYTPGKPVRVGIASFITSFILYGYLIPISLYVSIEIVKVVQIVWIARDRSMYHAETDTPAIARTSNLNEELGMVNTVLSDKTGTLTRNVMEFFKCSIAGVAYGAGVTEVEKANNLRKGLSVELPQSSVEDALAGASYKERYFNFYDRRIMNGAWVQQPHPEIHEEFFRLLAVCHTVIPDGPPENGTIKYEAESPDESALVVAAKVAGFFFIKRTNTTVIVRERLPSSEGSMREVDVEYEVLNILEFNSTRKRMSVICRGQDGRIVLYCKGADTVIYERLDRAYGPNEALKASTNQHMEDFGSAGLRTLCLSWTEVDPDFYAEWQEKWIDAKTSLTDREAKIMEVSELVEKDLRLLGCTAIEDKLQEGVPDCIATLAKAGIRIWVLTGDKRETAINIGYACSLITDEMVQFHVSAAHPEVDKLEEEGKTEEAHLLAAEKIHSQLETISSQLVYSNVKGIRQPGSELYALVIDGKALTYALSDKLKELFLQVGLQCVSVICCRVSPLQKAQVTALVKSNGATTLAIGDGANDVGMIQKAHIGVGISGQEGMQAVMAADFAIAQFRYLVPLLLVHGRYSYKRITRMVSFFFYKNMLFGSSVFAYNAFTAFSGQPIYNDFYMALFNVVFTSLPPLVIGWFDRDLDKQYALKFPGLYQESQQNHNFTFRTIVGWLINGLVQFGIIFTMVMVGCSSVYVPHSTGQPFALYDTGIAMFTIIIITVNLQLGLILEQWTVFHHIAIWLSIALNFLYLLAFGGFPLYFSLELYKLFTTVTANSWFFWLFVLGAPVTALLPGCAFRGIKRMYWPTDSQIVEEYAKLTAMQGKAENDEEAALAQRAFRLGPSKSGDPRQMREKKHQNKGYVGTYDPGSHPGMDSQPGGGSDPQALRSPVLNNIDEANLRAPRRSSSLSRRSTAGVGCVAAVKNTPIVRQLSKPFTRKGSKAGLLPPQGESPVNGNSPANGNSPRPGMSPAPARLAVSSSTLGTTASQEAASEGGSSSVVTNPASLPNMRTSSDYGPG